VSFQDQVRELLRHQRKLFPWIDALALITKKKIAAAKEASLSPASFGSASFLITTLDHSAFSRLLAVLKRLIQRHLSS
jgi:hypothetical protein